MEQSALMQKHRSSETGITVLRPTTPPDIGNQAQRARIHRRDHRELRGEDLRGDDDRRHRRPCPDLPHHLLQALRRQAGLLRRRGRLLPLRAAASGRRRPLGPATRRATLPARPRPRSSTRWPSGPGLAQLISGDAMAVDPAVIERYRRATIPALEALWSGDGVYRGPAPGPAAGIRPGPGTPPQPDRERQNRPPARAAAGDRLPGGQPLRRPRGGARAVEPGR